METTIKVYEKIGSEGRSRVNAAKLGLEQVPASAEVTLDFQGVNFLSRSFTDEIVNRLDGRKYKLLHADDVITNMFGAVIAGRSKARVHSWENSSVKSFSSMAELSRFLNMMM